MAVAGISDEAVRAKTGKSWSEWFAVLDSAGAADMNHPAIAKYLYHELGVSDWWSQMVTVGYEQARGRRRVHETARGFQISRSKTIEVSAARAFRAWSESNVAGAGCQVGISKSEKRPPTNRSGIRGRKTDQT
jgi:hypothetical protein